MSTDLEPENGRSLTRTPPRRATKKEQIVSLFASGVTDVGAIADITAFRPSHIASVLQEADLIKGYFDLYTHCDRPMNVYSQLFAGQLGFRDEDAARESVKLLDQAYRGFERAGDRAGQHHALVMALTMFDRARWINKGREAEVFRQWLVDRLLEIEGAPKPPRERRRLPARRPPRKG
jgi:hypothetical protein